MLHQEVRLENIGWNLKSRIFQYHTRQLEKDPWIWRARNDRSKSALFPRYRYSWNWEKGFEVAPAHSSLQSLHYYASYRSIQVCSSNL